MSDELEFSRPIVVEQLPPKGRTWELTATPEECARLADRMAIPKVLALEAKVKAVPLASVGMVRVSGDLSARVVQTCVVTLEPLEQTVSDHFSMTFGNDDAGSDDLEINVDYDQDDPPDPVIDGKIDLGEAVAEHLALALDPYPRAPGAESVVVEVVEPNEVPTPVSPFAALSGLKNDKL